MDHQYHLENLKEQDPDYIVDVLELTAEDILLAFPRRAMEYIETEYG